MVVCRKSRKRDLDANLRLVRSVCPQAMVASSDSQSGPEVVDNRPDSCWDSHRSIQSCDTTEKGNDKNQCGVDPVDMLVPVAQCNRLLADVLFLAIQFRG